MQPAATTATASADAMVQTWGGRRPGNLTVLCTLGSNDPHRPGHGWSPGLALSRLCQKDGASRAGKKATPSCAVGSPTYPTIAGVSTSAQTEVLLRGLPLDGPGGWPAGSAIIRTGAPIPLARCPVPALTDRDGRAREAPHGSAEGAGRATPNSAVLKGLVRFDWEEHARSSCWAAAGCPA